MVPPPTIAAQQYKIVAGDNFSTLAKKFNVTTKAIVDANPGVDPTKLQIGQTITIPPPSAPVPNGGAPTLTAPAGAGGMQVYSVKSGDTLTSIAAQFRVSLKALRAANPNLPTDRIKVGDKINIPPKAPTAPPAPAPTTPTGQ
jgi:LysM repeat protein